MYFPVLALSHSRNCPLGQGRWPGGTCRSPASAPPSSALLADVKSAAVFQVGHRFIEPVDIQVLFCCHQSTLSFSWIPRGPKSPNLAPPGHDLSRQHESAHHVLSPTPEKYQDWSNRCKTKQVLPTEVRMGPEAQRRRKAFGQGQPQTSVLGHRQIAGSSLSATGERDYYTVSAGKSRKVDRPLHGIE